MLKLLTRLFGYNGYVRIHAVDAAGATLTTAVKVRALNCSKEEVEEELRKKLYIHTGRRFMKVTIVAAE